VLIDPELGAATVVYRVLHSHAGRVLALYAPAERGASPPKLSGEDSLGPPLAHALVSAPATVFPSVSGCAVAPLCGVTVLLTAMKKLRIVILGWHGADRKWSLNDGQILNPLAQSEIAALSTIVPRGFGFVHHSRTISVAPCQTLISRFATFSSPVRRRRQPGHDFCVADPPGDAAKVRPDGESVELLVGSRSVAVVRGVSSCAAQEERSALSFAWLRPDEQGGGFTSAVKLVPDPAEAAHADQPLVVRLRLAEASGSSPTNHDEVPFAYVGDACVSTACRATGAEPRGVVRACAHAKSARSTYLPCGKLSDLPHLSGAHRRRSPITRARRGAVRGQAPHGDGCARCRRVDQGVPQRLAGGIDSEASAYGRRRAGLPGMPYRFSAPIHFHKRTCQPTPR
jgi:hypothetical protein